MCILMTCFNVASISQDVIDLTFNRVLSCLVISCHFISTPLMFQNTQYEERARGASISPSFPVSFFHRAAGSGRWEKLKSERSCAKLRFDFLPAAHARRGRQGGRDKTRTMWLKSLNFLQGVHLSRLFKRCCSSWGACERREGHIHGTYVVISDWEREREGDEKRCRISICCANITKSHTWVTPFY